MRVGRVQIYLSLEFMVQKSYKNQQGKTHRNNNLDFVPISIILLSSMRECHIDCKIYLNLLSPKSYSF